MSAHRSRSAAWAVLLLALWGADHACAQTWIRSGDILFDSFGDPPHEPILGEERSSTIRTGGERFVEEIPAAPPAALTVATRDASALPYHAPAAAYQAAPGRATYAAAAHSDEWHLLPGTLLYHAYLAGEKEPRIGLSVLSDSKRGWLWESALGGRVGILRRGELGLYPANAWQIDLEGAALARVNPSEPSAPLEATDYRIGIQWTKRTGPTAYKAGYYHISSHVGDEFLLANPGFVRINYVRDSLVFGVTRDVVPDVQVYGEFGYALGADGGAEPLEFQFGVQYVPIGDTGLRGAPFAAANVHLREEVDFGGGINVMAGWRWRNAENGRMLRIGLQYYNGKSIQYEFLNEDQQLIGYGIWFDY